MVFFSCNACGESLKKAAVEKHYQFQCRGCTVLSCIDCGKDFPGETYREHIKCISEEEKYSGKGYKPKPNANKGEVKQELWIQQVQEAINKTKTDPKLRGLLERLKDYPNIPRKKAKFENFLKNSVRVMDSHLVSRTWDVISTELHKPQQSQTSAAPPPEEGAKQDTEENGGKENQEKDKKLSKREKKEERRKQANKDEKKDKKRKGSEEQDAQPTEETITKKKGKKRKHQEVDESQDTPEENGVGKLKKKKKKSKHAEEASEDEEEEEQLSPKKQRLAEKCEDDDAPSTKFSWEGVIVGVLKKADDKELSIKKLRKKVLAEYASSGGDPSIKSEEKLWAKFNKKVSKNPQFRVLKDRVKLLR